MLAVENYPILADINKHQWSLRGRLPVSTMFSLTFLALAQRERFTRREFADRAGIDKLYNTHPIDVFLHDFSDNGMLDQSATKTRTYAATPELTAFADAYTALRVDLAADATDQTRRDVVSLSLGLFALAHKLPNESTARVMGHLTNLPPSNVMHNGVEALIAATGISERVESAMGALLLAASK